MAKAQGWTLPSARTAQRRLEALPSELVTLERQGEEALKRLYPAQRRSVGHLRALAVVNADGHIWDVFVKWEDGTIGRPVMIAFQDIYSRAILSWRLDRSENKEAVRLAFGDIVERWGIPDMAVFDNGRHFASKWLTGGSANRFRFKLREDEPVGIMTQLGVDVRFTLPYSGQSKPIERVFGTLAGSVAKDPRFAGAYVGNNPMAKPENYGSHAVPIAEFRAVLAQRLQEFNDQVGRRGGVAAGRSYQQVLDESWANATSIRRATSEQRRLWLMAAEAVTVNKDSTVHLLGNRYHADFLVRVRGQRVTVRFDPDNLHGVAVHLYRQDGVYLGEAPCIADVGFADKTAAQDTARNRKAALNHARKSAEALDRMKLSEAAKLMPALEKIEAPPPEQRVIRPVFGNTALKADLREDAEDAEQLMLRGLAQTRGKRPGLRLIDGPDEDV
jgi:transposase InsO family protein